MSLYKYNPETNATESHIENSVYHGTLIKDEPDFKFLITTGNFSRAVQMRGINNLGHVKDFLYCFPHNNIKKPETIKSWADLLKRILVDIPNKRPRSKRFNWRRRNQVVQFRRFWREKVLCEG